MTEALPDDAETPAATNSKDWTAAQWDTFVEETRNVTALARVNHVEALEVFKVLQDRGYVITKAE